MSCMPCTCRLSMEFMLQQHGTVKPVSLGAPMEFQKHLIPGLTCLNSVQAVLAVPLSVLWMMDMVSDHSHHQADGETQPTSPLMPSLAQEVLAGHMGAILPMDMAAIH